MMVEFIEQDSGNQLTVSASEFLKADKNQEEYASLAMATDAYSALFGIEYITLVTNMTRSNPGLGKQEQSSSRYVMLDTVTTDGVRYMYFEEPDCVKSSTVSMIWDER